MVIAVKKETMTPMARVMANPLITSVPKKARMTQVISVEMLLSRMAGNARRKPVSTATGTLLP